MNKLQLATDRLNVKRRELAAIFEEGGADLTLTEEQVAEVKARNAELVDIGKEVESLRDLTAIEAKNREALADDARVTMPAPHAGGTSDVPSERKSLGRLFIESAAYKSAMKDGQRHFNAQINHDVKTLMAETGAGFAPQAIRTGVVVPSAQQLPKIVDLIPSTTTTMVAVVYMQESTYTNAAAETAEGALAPEAALAYSQVTSPVEKIAVFLPVTDEQLGDVQGMEDRLNNRLTLMIRQRLDTQIVNGNGTSPNLLGLLNTTGILTQAKAAGDTDPDAVLKGIVKVQSQGFAEPNAIAMNPVDWQNIRLLRTADGIYLFGAPAEQVAPTLWGLPVVTSTYLPQGTAVTADFAGYTELSYRAGLEFAVSDSHSDFFQRGQLAIRCQIRVAMVVYRPTAICSVTSL